MDLIAYALRPDLPGEYTGGVLAIDGADFHTLDELNRGEGTICIWSSDTRLSALLDAVPVFERLEEPPAKPKAIITPFDRLNLEQLRQAAAIAGLQGYEDAGELRLRSALEQLHIEQWNGTEVEPLDEPERVVDLNAAATGTELPTGTAGEDETTDDPAQSGQED